MSVAAEADLSLQELIDRQQSLAGELREVEHWRRLVAARLDLAIAAVTDIDELSRAALPCTAAFPFGLRQLIGIPPAVDALADASVLLPLRRVLDDLDRYGQALRDTTAIVTRALLERLDSAGSEAIADEDGQPSRTWSIRANPSMPADLHGGRGVRARRLTSPRPTAGEDAG